ncbi:MAG: carbohydrate kinase [Cyanothece sp. SIO1E1]|nr:carbohydrate kinase [Cyanothece sp. SIO1E1]
MHTNRVSQRARRFDIIAVGELLVDLISSDFADNLHEVKDFKRLQGGSPANLSMNMARLDNKVKLIATIGQDDMGEYLFQCVDQMAIDCSQLNRIDLPTSLILVTRSKGVSNFEAYRAADYQITEAQLSPQMLRECTIFHTTCFGLSREPARSAILMAAEFVAKEGGQLAIDLNYAPKIWPDQLKAQEVVAQYCSHGALVKVSDVDWQRLYNREIKDKAEVIEHFLDLGAKEVCLTLGAEGCLVSNGSQSLFLPSREIQVKDTTGAGDAFWSGYLTAWLDGVSLEERALAGRKMAELKLVCFGPLPAKVPRSELYTDVEGIA